MSDVNILDMQKTLQKYLDKERFEHTLGVMYTCASLAMCHGYNVKKAQVAGLLHDCAKCIPNKKKLKLCKQNKIPITKAEKENPFLLHAKVGAYIAKTKYDIQDSFILDAIACHTTGKPGMNMLDKLLYIADYIEPWRFKAPNLSLIRKTAFSNPDAAMFMILQDSLYYLSQTGESIDPITKETFDYYQGNLATRKGD